MTVRQTADRPLTAQQVADRFGVHRATVGQWAKDGKLAFFTTAGGQRRFLPADVDRFYAESFGPEPETAA